MKNKFNRVISKIAGLTGRDKTAPARRALTAGLFVWAVLVGVFFGMRLVFALNAPPPVAGVGGGSLSTDSAQNLGLGATATTSAKLYVVPGINNAYGVKVDGKIYSTTGGFIFPDGTTQTTAGGGTTISAANVSSGAFGANTGGGNYSFPASVGIGTSAPAYRFTVDGASLTGLIQADSANSVVNLGGGSTNGRYLISIGGAGSTIFTSAATGASDSAAFLVRPASIANTSGTGNIATAIISGAASLNPTGASTWGAGLILGGPTKGGAGTFTNMASLFIESTPTGGTNNYGIYQTGSGFNYFAGNVGIGTTAPNYLLAVDGTKTGVALSNIHQRSTTGDGLFVQNETTSSSQYVLRVDNGSTAGVLYVQGTGNVGIGTTGPRTLLDVNGASSFNNRLDLYPGGSATRNGVIGSQGDIGAFGLTDSDLIIRATGRFAIGTNNANTARLVIATDGSVGIGTTAPATLLHLAGASPVLEIQETSGTGVHGLLLRHGAFDTYFTQSGGADSGIVGSVDGDAIIRTSKNILFSTDSGSTANVYIKNGGNVGIGTTAPGYKLDVVSGGVTTARFGTASTDTVIVGGGVGKIDVGTVDPVYTINGVKYATYLPGMTGQKEETTGVIILGSSQVSGSCDAGKLNNGKIYCQTIDFANAQKGSDLWLFSKATNLKNTINNLTVLLTPAFEGKVWYKKDVKQNRLTIFALPVADSQDSQSMEISYRLTAPRFDADKWTNYYQNVSGNDITGFIIGD